VFLKEASITMMEWRKDRFEVTTQTTYYPWETRLSIFQRTRERG
jgi:hypothetical protein